MNSAQEYVHAKNGIKSQLANNVSSTQLALKFLFETFKHHDDTFVVSYPYTKFSRRFCDGDVFFNGMVRERMYFDIDTR